MFSLYFSFLLVQYWHPTFYNKVSESSLAEWSRAMVYESIDHGNDVTCHAVLAVLFLVFSKKINFIVKNKSP